VDGKAYLNAGVLVMLSPAVNFKIIKTQSFTPTGNLFKVTSVDENKRIIKEFDNEPAGLFYAKQIGVPVEEIHKYFLTYVLGIMVGDEPFVREIAEVYSDYSLRTYCAVPEGVELQILKQGDMINDIKTIIKNEIRPLGNLIGIIHFHCMNRAKYIKYNNLFDEYKNAFKNLPIIGFNTYGEYYITYLNQSSVMLVLYNKSFISQRI
jgi:hypothetical protein